MSTSVALFLTRLFAFPSSAVWRGPLSGRSSHSAAVGRARTRSRNLERLRASTSGPPSDTHRSADGHRPQQELQRHRQHATRGRLISPCAAREWPSVSKSALPSCASSAPPPHAPAGEARETSQREGSSPYSVSSLTHPPLPVEPAQRHVPTRLCAPLAAESARARRQQLSLSQAQLTGSLCSAESSTTTPELKR